MSTATRVKPYTFDDFCALVGDGRQADLIDGVIYMASPDNTSANKLFIWLGFLMEYYAESKGVGEVFGSRVALRFDKINGPEPDIVFILEEHKHRIKLEYIDGPADIAVEIVSPDSVDRDYVMKRAQYERFGVSEYWILDEVKQTTTFLRLDKNRKYREAQLRDGIFRSQVLAGFWLRPEWLWQSPRPKKMDVLQLILGPVT